MYDNQNYATSAEAVEAARQDIRTKVNSVPARKEPIANTVLVYTPSLAWARRAVLIRGNAGEEQIRYVATVLYYGFYAMAEGLKRRNLFRSIQISEFSQRDPLSGPNYQYLVWFRLDGPDSGQWMISPGDDTSAATPLYTSPISGGGDRIGSFVNSIEEYINTRQ